MCRMSLLLAALLLALPVALLSCGPSLGDDDDSSGDDDDDSVVTDDDDSTPSDDDDSDGDDDTVIEELVEIVGYYPEAGATDVLVSTVVYVEFSGPTEATPSLSDGDGTPVAGLSSWVSPTRLVFTPDSHLEFSTDYTAAVVWTDGSDSMQFTTSDVGSQPVGTDMTGSTYAWGMGSGTVLSPVGGEALLGGASFTLLTGITGQAPGYLEMVGSLAVVDGSDISQDLCVEPADLTAPIPSTGDDDDSAGDDDDSAGDDDDSAGDDDDAPVEGNWNDPFLSAGPADLLQRVANPLTGGDMELTLYGSLFSGTFVADSSGGLPPAINGGSFSAHIDMRDTGMGFPCEQMSAFLDGIVCLPCPHEPGAQECVLVWVVDVVADLVPGLTMVPRTQTEIDADPACQ